MLRRLYLNNCFTHQDRTFNFENGLTGIIGPNESGKSLIVEMIRFALFGSKALRGKADDYKKLHVELDFTVGGDEFTVLRKSNKTTLQRNSVELASGTKPVDEAIRRTLGYDLHVFDVANACNQGNIEALSEMTPANRKAMVDKTIGLTVLDELIRHCGTEGNTLRREADAMARSLIEPVEPEEPENYRPSDQIDLTKANADLAEFNQLVGFLSQAPLAPVAPEACPITETAAELRVLEDNRLTMLRSIRALEGQRAALKPEELDEIQLDIRGSEIDDWDAFQQKKKLLAQGHLCCPECGHDWPVAGEALEQFAHLGDCVPEPMFTRQELVQHRDRLGNTDKIVGINQAIAELQDTVTADRSADILIRQTYEVTASTYETSRKAFEIYNADLPAKQTRHEKLSGIEQQVAALQIEMQAARQFETQRKQYITLREQYEKLSLEICAITLRSDDYLKAREIIQALKVSVKTHLLPSLNKVASLLLSQMTGGERYLVEVDEDFEITIDNQRIGTLSGSGKAVANLAIRIALGQILTNRVFSVFMADEVDAAMDDERAAYTAQALRNLTRQVGQVILVTHKRPETDQEFELKK